MELNSIGKRKVMMVSTVRFQCQNGRNLPSVRRSHWGFGSEYPIPESARLDSRCRSSEDGNYFAKLVES